MQLTQEILARYIGGQIEVQNPIEGYLYRGEVATITVEGDTPEDATLKVTLNWMAEGEGFPQFQRPPVNYDNREYAASLIIYAVSDIGDGRLCLNSPITGELVVLFPPNGNKLDPHKVVGLVT